MDPDAISQADQAEEDTLSLLRDFEKKLLRHEIERELRAERREDAGLGTPIPKLTRKNAVRYISACGRAVQLGHLSPKQASAMLYAAQLLIALTKLDPPPLASTRSRKRECRTIDALLPSPPGQSGEE